VIDEGHNVKTDLSYDMLRELNPSFRLRPITGGNSI